MNASPTNKFAAPFALLCALYFVLVWPAILSGRGGTSEAYDQDEYHKPVILAMADQWPRVDLVNYQSATAPGYHLLMAALHRFVSSNELVLRLLSSAFGLGLALAVFAFMARRMGGWASLSLTLPLLLSPYLISGSIWLTTDNAAWMFVAVALGGAVMSPAATPARTLAACAAATGATLVRQIHIWLIAPIGLAALLQAWRQPSRRAPLIAAAASLLVPCAILGWFIMKWDGLVPPGSDAVISFHARGANPVAVPFALAMFGAMGVFFIPAFMNKGAIADRVVWIAALLGFAIAMAFRTDYSIDAGRWAGPLWTLVKHLPAVSGRSIVFPPLAAVGAATLVIGWRCAREAGNGTQISVLYFGLICWLAAQSMNSQVWQRYFEPMTLMALAWTAALATPDGKQSPRVAGLRLGAPLVLAAIQFMASLASVYIPLFRSEPLP